MHLLTLGANHHSAPIDFRERLSFSPDMLTPSVRTLRESGIAEGVVLVSTCNRTELYLTSENAISSQRVTEWLSDTRRVSLEKLKQNTYQHNDTNVPRHLFRVASGLDSMALGEPQILGQLKDAYQRAVQANSVNSTLNQLFQHAFYVAKDVRTQTRLGENPISMVYAATKLPNHFFGKFEKLTAMIIGAGDTAQIAAKNLANMGVKKFIFANRTFTKAQALAAHYHGYAINLEQIDDHLHEADIVFSAATATQALIDGDMVGRALTARKQRMQLYLDLSVPRNIVANAVDNAYVYDVDDLKDIIDRNKSVREESAQAAEKLIETYHQDFLKRLALKRNATLIQSVQQTAQSDKDVALAHALRQLNRGDAPEVVIERLVNSLSKKIAHHPMKLIRHASDHGNDDMLALIEQVYDDQ